MIKFLIFFLIVFLNYKPAISRNVGETEITTEDGLEVFQEEKYYLLKKNVEILSDQLDLKGQLVQIYFEQDLYDIKKLIASDDVDFNSKEYNIKGKGDALKFDIVSQEIIVNGTNSELFLETTKMFSDGIIKVDNLNGTPPKKNKVARGVSGLTNKVVNLTCESLARFLKGFH